MMRNLLFRFINMNENREYLIDIIELFLRRTLIILALFLILYLIIFKWIWIGKKKNKVNINEDITYSAVKSDDKKDSSNIVSTWGLQTELWSHYTTDWNNIYYRWELVKFVNADEFVVMKKNEVKEISGTLINSDNLLVAFQDYDTRLAMMNTIDDIILNEKNVTSVLKDSSENGMYKIQSDYDNLSQYSWKDYGILTPEQKAKFAIVYLYVKIIKNTKWTVYMEQALKELKDFLENFDSKKLKSEVTDDNIKLKWNIGMDKHCIFLDWQLYACFLDEIF